MTLLNLLKIAAIVQFLAVSGFLVFTRKGNPTANRLLAVFLTAKALCWGQGILADDWVFLSAHPHLQVFALAADLLLGPSLYLYAKTLMDRDFRLKRVHLLHAVPAALYLVSLSAALLLDPATGLRLLFSNSLLTATVYSATYLQFVAYSLACLAALKSYRQRLKSAYSSIDGLKLSWLSFLVSGFIVLWAAAYANYLAEILGAGALIPWDLIVLAVFVFANGVVFRGLSQTELIAAIPAEAADPQYTKARLSEAKREAYRSAILSCMTHEKPYLDPDMTLEDFSRRTAIPVHHISQVLNVELKRNFFDFVNGYRVEECKSTLRKNADRTVLQILFDAGFNSKASFHRAFKKHTGMTPSQFRKTA